MNCGPLVSEATTLPTQPQTLPQKFHNLQQQQRTVLQFGHPNRFHGMKSRRLWRRHKNTLNSFFPSTPNREMKAHQKIVKLFSYRNDDADDIDDGEANDG